ncbi:phosphate uptake regulator PhoU (plasmid) [Haloferax mediterranei ATCC 33500]|uniref:Phosphate uptake regulator PhoU n=1 Tax=Haloferax mediterranei (strain ATCC 33500 / DSM 1411 / JCM 8866 / NBRC 14739 / NCIMB 2177 / R-4) TaxID=523841 RepID=I3RBB2_HALMT|nr:phosphate uptake regulator PhoU [Haloferax mediterranei]AFK21522.1 transcription regulator [Haloferax mediterranei ATCC 33500]AHZ24424.1 transcriptional regulator [Haloferax mediterranei ATCC 33500]ELZ97165.1 transcriptional regulator [Haloferax mediterranei ATCC 33500]MDX5990091.1 PhoU domain-containing protein [Haloferax mediterranei ATCC 33500]QCQ76824.1 phosphate uptake regulator PhoU [Haloferax mediterranei ATCC 33500]
METRKIQQVSNGTFTVSLPRDWADGEGITTGTVVGLHTHIDGVLVIQPPECEDESSIQMTVQAGDDGYLEQTLRAAYAAGSNEVVIEANGSFDSDQRQTIRRVARNLVGVTITEESEAHVTVRNALDANEVSIRQSVRQLQFVAVSMHRDATAALTGDAPIDGFGDRDDRADRLFAMVDRHFTRGLDRLDEVDALGETRTELFRLYTAARELERIADHAEQIASVASAVDESLGQPLADEIETVSRIVRDAVESAVYVAFAGEDSKTTRDIFETRDRVCEQLNDIERRVFDGNDSDYRFAHALHSLRRTAEHAGNIAEVGLRTAVRRKAVDEHPPDTCENEPLSDIGDTASSSSPVGTGNSEDDRGGSAVTD